MEINPMEHPEALAKVPTNFWTAMLFVRKQGAIGKFYQHFVTVRAEERDVIRYIQEELKSQELELSHVNWIGRIGR
jgi:hypothetical protein